MGEKKYEFNTYHTFVIQTKKRNKLIKYLNSNGIGSAIHYPIPIHLQPAAKYLGYKKGDFPNAEKQSKRIITIPINQNLNKREIHKIVRTLNEFLMKIKKNNLDKRSKYLRQLVVDCLLGGTWPHGLCHVIDRNITSIV